MVRTSDGGRAGADAHRRFYNADDKQRWGREVTPRVLPADLVSRPGTALEVGCGNGPVTLERAHSIVCDISFPALRRLEGHVRVQCDAERLPFRTGSADMYITISTLEHVPRPDVAVIEMDRVLVQNGVAYLSPAWNCRKWTATGVTVRDYKSLPLRLKLTKASLLLRERLWWRSAWALPRRLAREVAYAVGAAPPRMAYKALVPNLEEYLVSDSDAWASIDPHAAITFLRARRYRVRGLGTFIARVKVRNQALVAERA